MKVLTARDGEFAVSDEMRNMFAYLDDGRLLVAKTYAFNPHVRGFMSRLQHLGREFQVQYTDLSVVRTCYQGAEKAEEHSDMQRAAATLFQRAVKSRASDIHIRVSEKTNTRIFFRVHNDLEFVEEHPFQYGDLLCTTIFQAMADVSDSTFEKMSPQDARISDKNKIPFALDGIRIATSPQVGGYIMVLRLLYNDTSGNTDLGSLGYAKDQISAVEFMKKRPTGVMVIAGPTGSGKSTTLQRVLGSIIMESMGRKHIITVEDPPEYPIPGAVQTPVTNADTEEERSREYQRAIKAAMRLDPDIIMLSEVRDNPTARLVIQAAMTGHQVWTTVHANSALAIIDRLRDLGVAGELLSDPTVIGGLVCQRLVKLLCPHCKKPLMNHLSDFKRDDVTRMMSVLDMKDVYVIGDGCDHCKGSGTIGRTVVAETIVTDNALMKLVRNGDRIGAIDYVRREQSCKSMLEHAIEKINAGLIDPFQAEDVVGALNAGVIERDHRITPEELR
jgi:type II secretory ATPase GspE/PulE/Tfp pilus assembly ATPase PilB-like protein